MLASAEGIANCVTDSPGAAVDGAAAVAAVAVATDVIDLLVRNGNQSFAGSESWQWCIHGQDTILAEGRAYGLGIDTLGQQKFAIIFPVNALCV